MTDKQESPGDQPAAQAAGPAGDQPPTAEVSQPATPTAETAPAGEQATTAPAGAESAAHSAETPPTHPPAAPAGAESGARSAEAPSTQAPAAKRPPHRTRTWIAATAAAVMLLGGGVAGYFIGAANDHDGRGGPGWHQGWDSSRGDDRGGGFGGDYGGGFDDGPRAPWDWRGDR